jgi:hypothetical protein
MAALKPLRVAIVGSGPSLRDTPVRGELVVMVNSSIEYLRDLVLTDGRKRFVWFSLDPSPENMRIVHNHLKNVVYYVAFPPMFKTPAYVHRYERRSGASFMRRRGLVRPANESNTHFWLKRWRSVTTLSEEAGVIHSGNSAWGALGLVYLHKLALEAAGNFVPFEVTLFGIDATDQIRVTGGKPNNLSHLPILFQTACNQLQRHGVTVYNASPVSKIRCFPPPPNQVPQ